MNSVKENNKIEEFYDPWMVSDAEMCIESGLMGTKNASET